MKKKKTKVPFAVLRKGVFNAVLCASMLAGGAGLLAGCGQNANDGKDGATWLAGTTNPAVSQGVVGDFYYDTDDYKIYKKGQEGWTLVSTIKPAVSINDEGYWVIDGTTTEIKAEAVSPKIVDGVWVVGETNTGIEATGAGGKSAYELAKEAGYPGT